MVKPLEGLAELTKMFAGPKAAAEPTTDDREFSHIVYMRDAKTKDYLLVNRHEIKRSAKHTIYAGPILSTMQIDTYIAPDTGNAWKIKAIVNYLPPTKRSGRAVTVFFLEEAKPTALRNYNPNERTQT